MPSRQNVVKRDWGRGMATAGRTKTNTTVPKNHFGPIPGIEVGMSWEFRVMAAEVGVHVPHVAGIAGQCNIGCQSIVLAGGYEDDEDFGNKFTYTGNLKLLFSYICSTKKLALGSCILCRFLPEKCPLVTTEIFHRTSGSIKMAVVL